MEILLFIGFNLIMMSVFFVVGIYQFTRIEEKRKRHPDNRLRQTVRFTDLGIDETHIRQLVRDEEYETAIQRLISDAEVDRFTAEAAIEGIKQQEYRPYYEA